MFSPRNAQIIAVVVASSFLFAVPLNSVLGQTAQRQPDSSAGVVSK